MWKLRSAVGDPALSDLMTWMILIREWLFFACPPVPGTKSGTLQCE